MRRKTTTEVNDPLAIPEFLKIPAADRLKAWENAPVYRNPVLDNTSDYNRVVREQKRQKSLDRIAKMKRRQEVKQATKASFVHPRSNPGLSKADYERRLGEMTTKRLRKAFEALFEFDGRRYRLLKEPTVTVRPSVYTDGEARSSRTDGPRPPKRPIDDLAARLAEYSRGPGGVDRAKLRTLAERHGLWDNRYADLGEGLLRMTIGNKLRNLVKRGGTINWD